VYWRSAVVGGYIGWALLCSFVFGGGPIWLAFFAVWGGIWIVFSCLWRRADETRRTLLRRRGYY
jgi:hypothetical protein